MGGTREEIVAATAALLEIQGYHATGLNEILQQSGAPRGSLYYYFPRGKEELTAEAIELSGRRLAEHVRAELAREADAAVAVEAFVRRVGEHVLASECRSGAPIAAVALETAATNPRLAEACRVAYGRIQQTFADRLAESGYAPVQARELATFIVASLEGGIILSRTQRSAEPLQTVARLLYAVLSGTAHI
jgi:TetR/AcrR family transcriptional repressor of lmrAB and yxaGH operons